MGWLQEEIAKANQANEKVVVLTHHSPIVGDGILFSNCILTLLGCSNPDYVYGPSSVHNSAFSSDLIAMMNGNQISFWGYGHTHWFHDMTFDGTRVVSNPHGYPPMGSPPDYEAKNDPDNCYNNRFVVLV